MADETSADGERKGVLRSPSRTTTLIVLAAILLVASMGWRWTTGYFGDKAADEAIEDLRPAWRSLDLDDAAAGADRSGNALEKAFPDAPRSTIDSVRVRDDTVTARYTVSTFGAQRCVTVRATGTVPPNRVRTTTDDNAC